MRRLSLAMMGLAIAGLMTMVSCRKPVNQFNTTGEKITFSATTENNSKTYAEEVGGDMYVKWSEGDVISVNGNVFTLEGEGGETSGSFTGNVAEAPGYFASYSATNDGSSVTFTVPEPQDDNGTNLNGKIPMVAYTILKGGKLEFKNMVNILQLNLTGTQTINEIEVSSTEENLSGSFTVGTDLTPNHITSGTKKITVTKSLNLNEGQKTVYVVLPVFGSAESMVTVKFTGTDGVMTGSFELKDSDPESVATTPNHRYTMDVAVSLVSPYLLPGDFTVAEGKTVNFSRGNLYWDGTAEEGKRWKLESNQWDFQSSYSSTWADNNHISHFKWGNPTEAIDGTSSFPTGEFFATSGFTVEGKTGWRTLTDAEWQYLLLTRKVTVSGEQKASYGEGSVNGINGLIILPDNWDGSVCPSFTYGDIEWSNTFTESTSPKWSAMESAGAVFLPAAGCRTAAVVIEVGSTGSYWSSTSFNPYMRYSMIFDSSNVRTNSCLGYSGYCVRLVL